MLPLGFLPVAMLREVKPDAVTGCMFGSTFTPWTPYLQVPVDLQQLARRCSVVPIRGIGSQPRGDESRCSPSMSPCRRVAVSPRVNQIFNFLVLPVTTWRQTCPSITNPRIIPLLVLSKPSIDHHMPITASARPCAASQDIAPVLPT